jgi:hypothetical protein
MNMLKIWPAPNSCLAPTLQTCFEITINMRENNFNFGTTIYLKSRADRQAEKNVMCNDIQNIYV